ncbi:MAG TPA: RNA polymerase sigma factor [Dehalococcoidia bacterium]|nr:RNA polymerase sigma factor [Dehalococcoidia bacterium]
MGKLSDGDLIAASIEEPPRFVEIFERHFQSIYRYALRRAGAASADDIASETFLVAFAGRGSYRAEHADARPWLFGIATNLIRRRRRDEERMLRAYSRAAPEDHSDEQVAADDRVDARRLQPLLARALLKLRRPERDTLLLIAWADLTYQEAAIALNVPVGTVRSRLSRARERIRKELRLSGPEQEDADFGWNFQGEITDG